MFNWFRKSSKVEEKTTLVAPVHEPQTEFILNYRGKGQPAINLKLNTDMYKFVGEIHYINDITYYTTSVVYKDGTRPKTSRDTEWYEPIENLLKTGGAGWVNYQLWGKTYLYFEPDISVHYGCWILTCKGYNAYRCCGVYDTYQNALSKLITILEYLHNQELSWCELKQYNQEIHSTNTNMKRCAIHTHPADLRKPLKNSTPHTSGRNSTSTAEN